MNPGTPQILTCPHCGKKKEIMSLISGNTFGAELWSDNKQIAPMLPEISFVQKCPHCGKYFIRTRQEAKFAKEGYSFDQGLLTLPEMIEAFHQLSNEGFETKNEEANVRMMVFHAYNDFYYRSKEAKEVSEEHKSIFVEQGKWLLEHLISDEVMAAEFHREIGEMDKASSILDSLYPDNDFLKKIAEGIRSRIEENDTSVFLISE